MEKQAPLTRYVLRHVWVMNDRCTDAVIEKLADCNLGSIAENDVFTQPEFGF